MAWIAGLSVGRQESAPYKQVLSDLVSNGHKWQLKGQSSSGVVAPSDNISYFMGCIEELNVFIGALPLSCLFFLSCFFPNGISEI